MTYEYKLRPGYGSTKLLLEFVTGTDDEGFVSILLGVFKQLEVRVSDVTDLWMNNEILLELTSSVGQFTLSKDIWGFVFILADNNQAGLAVLDEYLLKSEIFKKIEVRFSDYK